MSNKEQRKAPVLRFKGFTDDWEQRKFSDIAQRISTNININLPNVTYDDIDSENETLNKGIKNLSSGKKGILFQKNDILFGKLRPYLNNIIKVDFKGIAVGDFWVLRAYEDSSFLFSLINTPQYKYIANISSGSKMPRSDWNLVSKYLFCIPSEKEQSHIGNLILKLSQLITLQQRKLDELDQLKKGTQQRLIVNNAIPQIRFNKFSGNWVRRKLNEITNYRNGKAHEKVINSNGKYIVINSKFISSNGTIIKHTDKNLSPLQKNDITFVLSDVPNGKALAKTYLVPFNNVYSLNQRIAAIKASNETDPYFLYFLLNRNEYFLRFDDHVGQTNLSKSDILSFTNFYPGLKEQQTIGKLLKITHERIINEKTKIVELRVLKEFLLQKLFI